MKNQREIAVRLYANPKLGNTHAKGLYHTAVFNAAADVKEPNAKYSIVRELSFNKSKLLNCFNIISFLFA